MSAVSEQFGSFSSTKYFLVEMKKIKNFENCPKNIPQRINSNNFDFFFADVGSNNSGYYTLQAVLTHRGRSSSSGHYVAWVRQKGETWLKCDDDNVSIVTSDEVLKLSGGGDWHCAYVLLYGPKILEIPITGEKKE